MCECGAQAQRILFCLSRPPRFIWVLADKGIARLDRMRPVDVLCWKGMESDGDKAGGFSPLCHQKCNDGLCESSLLEGPPTFAIVL